MAESRAKNTKRNIIFSFLDSFMTLGFQFISRSIIVYVFSSEYLGLSSLFSSILQILNMADLGFSAAIIYNMYKPLAEDDVETVCALLNHYKKIYRIVGTVILTVGISTAPLIPHLINGEYPTEVNIYVVYLLYLLNTVISYFLFAYKTALLEALQRLDLTKIAYAVVNILQYTMQIISIVCFKNYYMFIGAILAGTALKNIFGAHVSYKKYPQFICQGIVSDNIKQDIASRVKGLLICNISGMTYTTFDSIILSKFIGLSTVAVYSNYIMIFNGVMSFVVLIRTAMQASVGNSVAVESKEKNYQDMLLWQFLFSVIAIWCVTCLLNLYQPFMQLWMGENMLLEMRDVVLLCIWFFTGVVAHAFCLYISANGFWWEIRWSYILSAICNMALNIVLGKLLGITGIIFATVFSSLIFSMIWQCIVIFRSYYKNGKQWEYLGKQMLYAVICLASCILSFFLCNLVSCNGVSGLLLRLIICSCVTSVFVLLFFWKTRIFSKAKSFLLATLKI